MFHHMTGQDVKCISTLMTYLSTKPPQNDPVTKDDNIEPSHRCMIWSLLRFRSWHEQASRQTDRQTDICGNKGKDNENSLLVKWGWVCDVAVLHSAILCYNFPFWGVLLLYSIHIRGRGHGRKPRLPQQLPIQEQTHPGTQNQTKEGDYAD